MKRFLCQGILKGSLLTTLALAGLTPMLFNTADASQAFGIRFGNGVRAYPVYGRGGYGYGQSAGYGQRPYGGNNAYYGSGPYGYGRTNGRTWNSTYAPYNSYYSAPYNSYYNSSYYTPYSGWGYSPFGVGIQRSYGW